LRFFPFDEPDTAKLRSKRIGYLFGAYRIQAINLHGFPTVKQIIP
jgi:hypothetical protein